MPKEILASAKKDFWSSFTVPLTGSPAACKVANVNLFGELFSEKTVMVFGTYDIILLSQKGESQNGPVYDTVLLTRSFSENISLLGFGIPAALPGAIGVQTRFSRPLRIHVRPGRITNLKTGDLLRCLFSGRSCVEIQVESEITAEITAEITLAGKTDPEPVPAASREKSPEGGGAAEREAGPVPVRDEKVSGAGKEFPPAEKSAAGEGSPPPDLEALAALVAKILDRREEKGRDPRPVQKQLPGEADRRPGGADSPAGVKIPRPVPGGLDLRQIPSRPGLEKIFLQNAPPPKPPEKSG